MTELKTLKDLQGLSFRGECRLRQEAIKWIKELLEYGYLGEEYSQNELESIYCNSKPAIFWIKHFFNITDEELKT